MALQYAEQSSETDSTVMRKYFRTLLFENILECDNSFQKAPLYELVLSVEQHVFELSKSPKDYFDHCLNKLYLIQKLKDEQKQSISFFNSFQKPTLISIEELLLRPSQSPLTRELILKEALARGWTEISQTIDDINATDKEYVFK